MPGMSVGARGVRDRVKTVRSGYRLAMLVTTGSTRSIHGVAHGPSGEKDPLHIQTQMYRFGGQRIGEQSLAHGWSSQIASMAMAAAAMIAVAKQGMAKSNVS